MFPETLNVGTGLPVIFHLYSCNLGLNQSPCGFQMRLRVFRRLATRIAPVSRWHLRRSESISRAVEGLKGPCFALMLGQPSAFHLS